jgi:hypothetical protein
MKYSILVVGALFITGCSNVATNHRPESYYQEQGTSSSSDTSFFGDSAEGLDEKAIQKILSYRLALPSHSRVAILNLSQNNYWRRYSNDFILLDAETVKGLVGNLNDSPRIYDASFLPSLLIPEKKTLTHLRIAAARYQADMLLAYRSNCQSFEKYKFIDPNVTKAYCSVEAVALDVRSGIVPFTAVSTNEFTAEKKEDDVNFQETRRKAEMNAIKIGLTEISSRLRRFIEAMPKLTHKP